MAKQKKQKKQKKIELDKELLKSGSFKKTGEEEPPPPKPGEPGDG